MPSGIAPRAQPAWLLISALGLVLLSACDSLTNDQTPLPSPGFKPIVTFVKPANGVTVTLDEGVVVDAIAQDASGILRVDFTVNGALVDSQTLFVAARRFEYDNTWKPRGLGQNTLTIVAYNVNNVASDPVSILVSVGPGAATETGVPATATQTPYVIYITVTPPAPSRQIVTPIVTLVSATPSPTSTRTLTPTPIQTPTLVATQTQTPMQTQTPTPH